MTTAVLPDFSAAKDSSTTRFHWANLPGWALLGAGAAALPLSSLKWNLAPVAWVAAVPFLLYARRGLDTWPRRLALLIALLAGGNLMTLKLLTEPVPWMLMPGYGVPIALALWCVYLVWNAIRVRAGERWALYGFPASLALAEVIGYRLTEFGVWGASANTQLDDLRLLQLASLVGISGIGFMIGWVASAIALLISTPNRRRFRYDIGLLIAALAAIYAFGSVRLFTEQDGDTVRVAGIVADLGPTPGGLPDSASVARNTDDLFVRSGVAADRGARLVVWNEAATVVEASAESAFVQRGVVLARQRSIDLVLAYIVPVTNQPYRMENKYVWLSNDGTILETYYKHHPVPGEGSRKGDAPLSVIDRPFARAAGAICYDYDFPAMGRGHAQLGAGLVVVPSSDWRGIDPYHTQMARLRAIEGGFSLLRPVRWATSGAFDAYGRARASMSHFEANDRIIMATLPVQPVRTVYARIGDAPVIAYASIILFGVGIAMRRRKAARQA